MFTGIVKAIGTLERIDPRGGDRRLTVVSPSLDWPSFTAGESIAVNGVCLTAVEFVDKGFVADVSSETLAVTSLCDIEVGRRVNLEPAIALSERLGGHLVSGHVDCVGRIVSLDADARSLRLGVELPQEHARYVAKKGSVCVDGVSLTVNAVSASGFEVNIIPHTAEVTVIGDYRTGTKVNIEVDLVARYLERLLQRDDGDISREFLREHGYA